MIVLPVDDISNRAAELVASQVPGVLALTHAYERPQFGEDLKLHFRTLAGLGRNPNVASVIVLGIEPAWTARIAKMIEPSGKPIACFSIPGNGDLATAVAAARTAKKFLQDASELDREPCTWRELVVSAKCGETTELTGAEQIVADRCMGPEVREAFLSRFVACNDDILRHKDGDMLESNPTRGNMEGGISTIAGHREISMTRLFRTA